MEQTKMVFEITSVLLKNEGQIEGLFFVYFLALLVQGLIEREWHRTVQCEGIDDSPSIIGKYHKDEQHSTGYPWGKKEFDRYQIPKVLVKKHPPIVRRQPISTSSVFFQCRSGNPDSKLRELSSDSK